MKRAGGVVGVDEVGRGCWAGPLVAAAVLLSAPIDGLKDSKMLTRRQRERLDLQIRHGALAFGIGWVKPSEIDKNGLTWAVRQAMVLALAAISAPYAEVIIDGSYNFLPHVPAARTIVKADATVPAVSAASIIAKVARDNFMIRQAATYPLHGFEHHVGYGTRLHRQMISEHGVTKLHRLSFKPLREFAPQ